MPLVSRLSLLLSLFLVVPTFADEDAAAADRPISSARQESPSRLSDEVIPLQVDQVPARPDLLMEWGEPFLGTGEIGSGFELPTGAVWNPSLLAFGNFRTALQVFDTRAGRFSDWASRLDLFTQLSLTPTERILVGIRPFDDTRNFIGHRFLPEAADGWNEELDANIDVLFFEGDFGELFPRLDPADRGRFDLGFSVGRQQIQIQEGILINDIMDAAGVVKNNLISSRVINWRLTALAAWEDIHRDDNFEDDRASLFGIFNEFDFSARTVNLDMAFVASSKRTGDGLYFGLSGVETWGSLNATWRVNTSVSLNDDTTAVATGWLPSLELSWTPTGTEDVVYVNGFWAIDEFTSAARGPTSGGALARTGILFEAVGLGLFGAPLSNRSRDAVGGAFGYQWICDGGRRQLILELGTRWDTEGLNDGGAAIGARFQQAIGQRWLVQPQVFGNLLEGGDDGYGARIEFQCKF